MNGDSSVPRPMWVRPKMISSVNKLFKKQKLEHLPKKGGNSTNSLKKTSQKYKNTTMKPNQCLSDNWITSQVNGKTGNHICEYAHLKYLQLKYKSQVIQVVFVQILK